MYAILGEIFKLLTKESRDFGKFLSLLKLMGDQAKKNWMNFPSLKIGRYESTILHSAVEMDTSPEVLQMLLVVGADCNLTNHKGDTPLHLAIEHDNARLFECLIKHTKVEINKANNFGETPLRYCLKNSFINLSMYKTLIEKGADLNSKDQNGNGLLHHAVLERNLGAVKILLDNGADPKECNNAQKCPLYLAEKEVHDERIVGLLNSVLMKHRKISLNLPPRDEFVSTRRCKTLSEYDP